MDVLILSILGMALAIFIGTGVYALYQISKH
jgi:hypothetical protein